MVEKRKINDRIVLILIIALFSFLFSYGYISNKYEKQWQKQFDLNSYMCCKNELPNNSIIPYCTDTRYDIEKNKCVLVLCENSLIIFNNNQKCEYEPVNSLNGEILWKMKRY